jgi:hypothetical protein
MPMGLFRFSFWGCVLWLAATLYAFESGVAKAYALTIPALEFRTGPQSPAVIAYEPIPRPSIEHIPIVSMGYGRTSPADGRVFPRGFNFPATYWPGTSIILKYFADQERGETIFPDTAFFHRHRLGCATKQIVRQNIGIYNNCRVHG